MIVGAFWQLSEPPFRANKVQGNLRGRGSGGYKKRKQRIVTILPLAYILLMKRERSFERWIPSLRTHSTCVEKVDRHDKPDQRPRQSIRTRARTQRGRP